MSDLSGYPYYGRNPLAGCRWCVPSCGCGEEAAELEALAIEAESQDDPEPIDQDDLDAMAGN